ncbi:hypothetical protein ACVMB0_007708 [Bradyrhizobium sp. USDA 4451]
MSLASKDVSRETIYTVAANMSVSLVPCKQIPVVASSRQRRNSQQAHSPDRSDLRALGQHSDGAIVAMKAIGSEHPAFDHVEEWRDGKGPWPAKPGYPPLGRSLRFFALSMHGPFLGVADIDGWMATGLADCAGNWQVARRLLDIARHHWARLHLGHAPSPVAIHLALDLVESLVAHRPLARDGVLRLRRCGLTSSSSLARWQFVRAPTPTASASVQCELGR